MGLRIGKIALNNKGSLFWMISEPASFVFRSCTLPKSLFIFLLFGLFFCENSFSQTLSDGLQNTETAYRERGLPYIQNYNREEYNAGPDNWAIVQSREGIMYFGNKDGVLEYDGVSWRLIQLSNESVARTLAIDQNNNIYVGGKNDLGFLAPDSTGQMQFISLKNKLDPAFRDFQSIWFTHVINNRVYFSGFNYLMEWDGNEFNVREPDERFRFSTVIDDTLFIVEENVGIRKMVDDTLQTTLPHSELNGVQLYGLVPYNDDQLLALSYQNGLFLIENNSIIPFTSPANEYLKNKFTYHLELLPNGWYSIGTLREGIVVMDKNGQVVHLLHKDNGLVDNSIYYQYTDRQDGLWLAASQGISRVELLSPFTVFDDRMGVDGFVSKVLRHQDTLYVANNQGLLRLEELNSQTSEHRFELVESIREDTFQGFDLLAVDQSLFALLNPGVYEIKNGEVINDFPYRGSTLFRSHTDSTRLYIGLFEGLASLKQVDGRWIDEGEINGVVDDIRGVVEDENGNLWLKSQTDGVWRVVFSATGDSIDFHNPNVKHFRENRDIPAGSISLSTIRGEPVFGINGEVYRYHAEMDSIILDFAFGEKLGLHGKVTPKTEDEYGNIWMFAHLDENEQQESRIVAIPGNDDTYEIKKLNDERITQLVGFVLYPEDDGVVWYGGSDGLVRHNTNLIPSTYHEFQPLIRKITVNNDSLIFGGTGSETSEIILPYRSNDLRFEFAAPFYDEESANQFQFFLEGFDDEWSAWTNETQKDYTNIPEGAYTFHIRAKNIYGQESRATVFPFKVLPPMHRTWWAYGLYGFILLGFIAGIVQWRSRKLQKEKEVLQNMVEDRTRKVKQQAEQLKELDQAKSDFFANISHEFRTPLTLILGQINQLESGYAGDNPVPVYQVIKRNGQRLLGLVNQLLDLSTLESGKMKLQAKETDLVSFMKPIVAAYNSLAESKGIEFRFESSEKSLPVYLDRDKMEKIVQNVVSNAFKFTDNGGRITVKVALQKTNDGDTAQIEISDTGKGIAPEHLDKVFDRFYRGDSLNTDKGSGIGLALAKELVSLHRGTISAESTVGEGACFTIVLPMGREHFRDDEVIEKTPVDDEWQENESPADYSVPETIRETSITENTEAVNISDSRELPRILVVEDNVDMRQYIRQILQPGYKIAEASDGAEGWEKAVGWVPNLVISDVMMPETDGFKLCKKLKNDERTSHIPVVLLTAKAGKESKMEGLETRADDYLTKPFDQEELLILIRNRIEQRARLRKRFSREVTVQPKDIAITSADERFLQKAIDVVEKHMEDFDFNVETFVEQMHLGHTQVNRKIKALTDLTPVQFIRFLRLKRAAQKVAQQEDTVSQIAYSVGFNNLSYFSKCFKEQYGQLPSEYKGE